MGLKTKKIKQLYELAATELKKIEVSKAKERKEREAQITAERQRRIEAKISSDAIDPMTKNFYPRVYAAWGKNKFQKINALMKPAAIRAASSSRCDRVEIVALSDSRSSPPNNIVFFVDCANGQRFYISEKQLENNAPVLSNQEKAKKISDPKAIELCKNSVISQLQFPSSFDQKVFSASVYRAPTGNVVVTFDFDAKNGVGNVLPQKARCVIDDQGINPPEITNR